MLDSKDSHGTFSAVSGLLNIAANPRNRSSIAQAGGNSPLVRLVKTGSDEEKTWAAAALIDLAIESDIRDQISADSFPAFVDLDRSGTVLQQEQAVSVLRNLSLVDENGSAIVKAGAVAPLPQLVENGADLLKEDAAATLLIVARNAFSIRAIIDAGGVSRLVTLLQRGNRVQQEHALAALRMLVFGNEIDVPLQIVNADTVPLLAQLMENGSTPRQRKGAFEILSLFSRACSQHCEITSDVIAPLLKSVQGQYSPARAIATATLANLAFQQTAEVASEIVKCDGIHILVRLLGGRPNSERANAMTALMNLSAMGDKLKVAVANAGGLVALNGLSQVGTEKERDHAHHPLMNFFSKEKNTAKVL